MCCSPLRVPQPIWFPIPSCSWLFLIKSERNSWHRVGATTHHYVQPGPSWTKGLEKVTRKKIFSEDGNIFAEARSPLKWPVRGKRGMSWVWSLPHTITESLRLEKTSKTSSPTFEWRISIYSLQTHGAGKDLTCVTPASSQILLLLINKFWYLIT